MGISLSSLTPVTFQQILIFLQVVESHGFAKASASLHMTQSAVSKSIAKLERDLEITLFTRTTREIHLTTAGQILYNEWKLQSEALYNGYVKAFNAQQDEHTSIHIGLLNTARPDRYFWQLEDSFKHKHPNVALELESEYMTDLVYNLAANLFDAIMIPDFEHYALEEKGLAWKWAARSNACVLVPHDNPLSEKTSVSTEELLNQTFISLHETHSSNYLADLTKRFAPYHVTPKIQFHFNNAYDIKYLFRPDNCILFADNYFDNQENLGFVKVPVKDQFNGIICGYNPANQNPQLQAFLDILPDVNENGDVN